MHYVCIGWADVCRDTLTLFFQLTKTRSVQNLYSVLFCNSYKKNNLAILSELMSSCPWTMKCTLSCVYFSSLTSYVSRNVKTRASSANMVNADYQRIVLFIIDWRIIRLFLRYALRALSNTSSLTVLNNSHYLLERKISSGKDNFSQVRSASLFSALLSGRVHNRLKTEKIQDCLQ